VTAGRVEPSDICIAESAFRSPDNHSRRLPLPGMSDKFVGEFIRGPSRECRIGHDIVQR